MIRAAWRVAKLLLRVRQPVRPQRTTPRTYFAAFDSGIWNVAAPDDLLIDALADLPDPTVVGQAHFRHIGSVIRVEA